MKDFHCRDVGMNCEFVARGDATEEVLAQTERHAEQVHHMKVTPELEEKMRWRSRRKRRAPLGQS